MIMMMKWDFNEKHKVQGFLISYRNKPLLTALTTTTTTTIHSTTGTGNNINIKKNIYLIT